jgi:hypothetical protein
MKLASSAFIDILRSLISMKNNGTRMSRAAKMMMKALKKGPLFVGVG